FARDVALDPGRASAPRMAMPHMLPSSACELSARAMSDRMRLHPTPHAIAVYASQPLSPVATQHSLPSRTLPFTWAGLSPAGSHQLCLAHSFNHLVGSAGRSASPEAL